MHSTLNCSAKSLFEIKIKYKDKNKTPLLRRGAGGEVYAFTAATFGAADIISSLAALAYCSKFLMKEPASLLAVVSNASLSFQVLRGFRISEGTPGHSVGAFNPKLAMFHISHSPAVR